MDWNSFDAGQNPYGFNQEYTNEQGDFNQNNDPTGNYYQPGNTRDNIPIDQMPVQKKETYYDILQICKTADIQEIKKAYRKQSLIWHPDKNAQRKEEAEERFKLISEAFQILSDDEKRSAYDNYGLNPVPVQREYDYSQGQGFPDPIGPYAVFASPFELFDQMFTGFSFDQGPLFHDNFPSNDAFFGGFPPMASPFNLTAFASPFGMLNHPGNNPMFSSFHNPIFSAAQNRGPVMSQSSVSSYNYGGETVIKTTTFINGRSATIIETNDAKGNIKRDITYT